MRSSNEGAELSVGPTAGTPTIVSLSADWATALGPNLLGSTVMRIRGEIVVGVGEEPATDVTDWTQFAWGIHIVDAALWTQAASAHPDPVDVDDDDSYADWMGYGSAGLIATGDATIQASGALDGAGWARIPVDVRARRKFTDLGQVLSLNMGATPETVFAIYHLSVLLALP